MLVPAAKKIAEEVSSILLQKYNLYSSFEDDFIKLRDAMKAISAVLQDAEKKQERSKLVESWLTNLQDALEDAEDLLDDINAEVLRQKVEAELRIVTWVRSFFFLSNMDERIKNTIGRIEDIKNLMNSLNLQPDTSILIVPSSQRELSHSYLSYTEVIGREKDAKNVIEMLLSGDSETNFVVPIVGMGGMGKTSLVQLVFNDDMVKKSFDFRIWINVSGDLSQKSIRDKKFIKAVDSSDTNVQGMDSLSERTREKKFLLVLDDVRNCNRPKCNDLKKFLGNGERGSRVLVTTRHKNTASIMGGNGNGNCLYQLGTLDFGVCMSLFERWAFGEGESSKHPNLVKIGEEIVIKCGGVPLALRTLGGILSLSKYEKYWKEVKNSDTWGKGIVKEKEEDIMLVLKLSYDQLPSNLRWCFAYCSILPKGVEFDKNDLILLWMAQGFIELEEVGNWYVNEFVSRYIFDVVHEDYKTEIVRCRMHDLFHDLAKLVAGNLMVNSSDTGSTNQCESARHGSFWDQHISEDPSSFRKLPKLRTLVLHTKLGGRNLYSTSASSQYVHILLSCSSTFLRVLDLSNLGITHLPNSIGNLKHLRYLNLSGNSELRLLPDSICSLHFLQTLKLSGCRRISAFPRNFSHLVSLRHLDIASPHVWEKQLGTLSLPSLKFLTIEHCRNLSPLNQMTQHLTALQTLCIRNCLTLKSLPSSLKNCTSLENLELVNCPEVEKLDVCMEGLCNLRSLTIKGLRKMRSLPIKPECYASSLQYLCIIDCISLMSLPDCMENLKSLMRINIRYCPNLLNLPYSFHHLTALQVLQIDGCGLLSTKCRRNVGEDWGKIAHVPEIYVDNVKI